MANRDKSSRRGLMVHSYKKSVYTRLEEANLEPIGKNEEYRYVKLGDEIFPIHKDMVEIYNKSDRNFKRDMKKSYERMVKKLDKTVQKNKQNGQK